MNFDETEEKSKEDDDDINYDQVLSLVNSKFLNPKQLKYKFYILNELTFNEESLPDEVMQRIWAWKVNIMTISSNI